MFATKLEKLTHLDLLNFQTVFFRDDSWTATTWIGALGDFRRMYSDFGPGIRRIGIYKGRVAPGDADDFVHDVLERVWKKRHLFRGEAPLKIWVFRFAYNVARNQAKLKRLPVASDVDCDTVHGDGAFSPEERALRGEAAAQLSLALDELTEEERRFFVMYLSTSNAAEAARMGGLTRSRGEQLAKTVPERLAKILARLQHEHGWRKR